MLRIEELQALLETIEHNTALFQERHFIERTDVLDLIEFHVMDALNTACIDGIQPQRCTALRKRAIALRDEFKQINHHLVHRLQDNIRSGKYGHRQLMNEFRRYAHITARTRKVGDLAYDSLDVLVNAVLSSEPLPEEEVDMEPEMVAYQPTPARVILDMIDQTGVDAHDVFFDIGSGLGHVPIVVSLLSGAEAIGIEFQRAYCEYARQCATGLNLPHVRFFHQDAREADFSTGTIFYMYTPFKGAMLQAVLARLHDEAQKRQIRVCTYGPYMADVAKQPWLTALNRSNATNSPITVFKSSKR